MKKFTFLLALLIILGSFAGCGQNTENSEKSGDEKEKVQETQVSEDEDTPYKESEAEKTQYPLTIKTFEQSVTFEKAPEKIGVFQYNAAEILAGLGLADKITALRGEKNAIVDVLPEYRDALEKVPKPEAINVDESIPTLENMLNLDIDVLILNSYFFNVATFGKPEDYINNGINLYITEGSYVPNCEIENTYNDIRNLGKIFDVSAKAESLIEELKKKETYVSEAVKEKEKVPTMILSGESDEKVWVAGGVGLANNILKAAGGENVFSDIDKQFASTTYEEVINRNPEVIVVVRNSGDEKGGEVSIEHLKNRPELSDVNAIKNNRFIVVTLNSIFPGIQNVYSLETIAKNLHPDAF